MKINMVYYAYMMIQLQQYLPFTVLKLSIPIIIIEDSHMLQQYLPFTVLKPINDLATM